MRREVALGGGLAVVVLAALAVALLAPGVFAEDRPDEPDGFVSLTEITISDGNVTGEHVELRTDVRLENRGGRSENVTVEFRAVGLESGLVETRQTRSVDAIGDKREVSVVANLTVERADGYRIEAVVYQDGERQDEGYKTVRGTDSLTPAAAETTVDFHRFLTQEMPVIEYAIADAGPNRTTLAVSTHLTNSGSTASEPLRLVLKARQVESNIVANETTVRVDAIAPGQTTIPQTTLSVPSAYNYYLDAVLYKEGVIVATARSGASLDPTETVSVNTTRRDVGLRVGDFERAAGSDDGERSPGDDGTAETPSESGPGFGIVVALVALVGGLLARARGVTNE